MARLPELYRGNLPPHIRSKVNYIVSQRRMYERIDGKFVGIGFKVKVKPFKGPDNAIYLVLDEELDSYNEY